MAFNKSKALEEAARLASQRKFPEAIKRYLAIAEKDPEDLSLLNTTGDLCVRAGNIPEALRQFNKLATAYSREGFILKAIAINKKIAKLDTQSADSFLKLAELYTSQGLSHEAREHYARALAFCEAHGLQEKTAQILTRLAALDPSNRALEKQGEMKPAGPGEARHGSQAGLPVETKPPAEPASSSADPRSPMPAVEMDFSEEWKGFTSQQTVSTPPVQATMDLGEEEGTEDSPQTHYYRGVALREMGLVDEAIGELQKAVKGAGKDGFPPHFQGACSLMGSCFLEKSEPGIAVEWYLRAFEAPDADEETSMALTYGLASAYEQLGDAKAALEKFAEVYRLKVDYRDVAEKIRTLRQCQPDH